jgi:polyhydroxyalkanoic acid synthase PhaR subunit
MSETNTAFDPFEAWRKMQEANMDAWAKAMVHAVNTDAYAKATGAILDAYLTASGPFREALEKTMTQALQQFSMPTRDDFVSLAERMTNIELRLDDLDAKLDRIERQFAKPMQQESK